VESEAWSPGPAVRDVFKQATRALQIRTTFRSDAGYCPFGFEDSRDRIENARDGGEACWLEDSPSRTGEGRRG
jgi:hypothetical protein